MPTHVGRLARGPSPVDAGPTGRGLPGRREASRVSALTTRRFRRRQALRPHEWSGGLAAGPVASAAPVVTAPVNGTPRRAWSASTTGPSRQAVTGAWSAWSSRWRSAVGAETARTEAGRRCAARGWDRRPRCASAGAPGPRWPDRSSGEQAAAESRSGATGPSWERGASLHGRGSGHAWLRLRPRGHHRRESPRPQRPRQLDRVTPVGVHAVTGLLGKAGGRDDPADLALVRQIARVPVSTGARFRAADQALGCGLQLAHAWITVAGPRANVPRSMTSAG